MVLGAHSRRARGRTHILPERLPAGRILRTSGRLPGGGVGDVEGRPCDASAAMRGWGGGALVHAATSTSATSATTTSTSATIATSLSTPCAVHPEVDCDAARKYRRWRDALRSKVQWRRRRPVVGLPGPRPASDVCCCLIVQVGQASRSGASNGMGGGGMGGQNGLVVSM